MIIIPTERQVIDQRTTLLALARKKIDRLNTAVGILSAIVVIEFIIIMSQ